MCACVYFVHHIYLWSIRIIYYKFFLLQFVVCLHFMGSPLGGAHHKRKSGNMIFQATTKQKSLNSFTGEAGRTKATTAMTTTL